ncbi:hypothetical protein [Vulcanococcus limneticus]|uniref:hypothetical protein n=1 Tax=Vulcanococcus limneticus TaxID=2170428 RepID=UPI00398C11B9
MGLFDRLLGSKKSITSGNAAPQPPKKEESFFLDPDAAKSVGDLAFMRRSNTIRHTFPGTASSPGMKELVDEVASMEAQAKMRSPGLPGAETVEAEINLTGGVPKPVKKTFAERLSSAELGERMKGSAVAVNAPGGPAAIKQEKDQASAQAQPQITQQSAKPGSTDAFKAWAKDITS